MEFEDSFNAWLDDEIARLDAICDEAQIFVFGERSEAIRIRAQFCRMREEYGKNKAEDS